MAASFNFPHSMIQLHMVMYLGLVDMHAQNANSKHKILSTFKVKTSTDKAGFQCFPQFEDI